MRRLITLSLFIVLISACTSVKHIKYRLKAPETFTTLHAIGYAPISAQLGDSKTAKILNAMRASKLDAYRELTEQVHGYQISSKTTFDQLVISNSSLKSSVQGLIRGAKVKKTYPINDDIYATELELDFKAVYELYTSSNFSRQVVRSN